MTGRPRRPADVVGNAVRVMQIATGEREEEFEPEPVAPPKNAAAVEMGKLGGRKRAEGMTPERRAEIARKAAEKRVGKGMNRTTESRSTSSHSVQPDLNSILNSPSCWN
ncbi:histone H1 [uncultured Enterovirga sp.]|uniref:histone H1 n=1 Tax=uncultured Enterovirga sp. TaxID=2026352 RepID=UPI0035CB272A